MRKRGRTWLLFPVAVVLAAACRRTPQPEPAVEGNAVSANGIPNTNAATGRAEVAPRITSIAPGARLLEGAVQAAEQRMRERPHSGVSSAVPAAGNAESNTNALQPRGADLGEVLARGLEPARACAATSEDVFQVQISVEVSEYGRVTRSRVSGAPAAMEGCLTRVVDAVAFPEARGEPSRQAYAAIELGQRARQPEPETTILLPAGGRSASTTLPARAEPNPWTTSSTRPASNELPASAPSVHDRPPPGYVAPSQILLPPQ